MLHDIPLKRTLISLATKFNVEICHLQFYVIPRRSIIALKYLLKYWLLGIKIIHCLSYHPDNKQTYINKQILLQMFEHGADIKTVLIINEWAVINKMRHFNKRAC